ncbi:MAG: HAD-IA family hydrolase [Alphaproteobacteria bacterium]
MLEAIIFDVDGTLAETEETHRRAFNAAFAAHGLSWHWDADTYRGLLHVGGGRERIRHHAHAVSPETPETVIQAVHEHKSRLYAAWVEAGALTPRPGVVRLLTEAQAAGIPVACATSSQRTAVVALLHSILGPGAENLFAVLGCGNDTARKKPAPDIYRSVLERLGLPADACIAIEDTAVGLTSSLAADVPSVVALSDYSEPVDFAGALAVVSDLGEPERPFSLIRGDAFGGGWVDVTLLRRWHDVRKR